MSERPEFTHQRERHGLIGPFSGRQILAAFLALVAAGIILVGITTPILRELSERYKDQGLEVIGVSVQETTADDVKSYADRYDLHYTIGFDAFGDVFHAYKVFALPTQFFIDTNGVIRQVANGPVDEYAAAALIESMLPPASSAAPSASPRSSASPSPS